MRKIKMLLLLMLLVVFIGEMSATPRHVVLAKQEAGSRKDCDVKKKTTKLKAPVIKKFKHIAPKPNMPGNEIYRLRWNDVAGASAYQLSIKDKNADGSWGDKRITYTRGTCFDYDFVVSLGIKVKVRAFQIVNGKKVYGKWSKTITKQV
ncbi:MAG: hypothetical protein J6D02_03410 [Lachnospira sp.]|nr:hypothetical protein [Lachnospira sp.]